jgi:hypothetical protein
MPSRLIAVGLVAAALCAVPALAQQPWPPGPGGAPQPQGPNPVCTRLEAQLASIDRGGNDAARAEQVRRYEDASNRQQTELDRLVAQGRRQGCESSGGFFIFGGLQSQSQQCVDLNAQISRMRGNLDRINVDLQRLRGGDNDVGEQRRSVMVALAQNNCGPQYRTAARAPGGFFDQLFGRDNGEAAPSGDLANPEAQSGTFRTVCVRTCDGFYFPISYATSPARFAQDEKTCQRLCPASEAQLFSYRTAGEDITQATSISGQPYTALPNALKYRTEFNPACSCKKPGQSWAEALGKDDSVAPGDVVVTEERAKQMSQPPAQKPHKGKQAQPAQNPPAAAAPPATAETPTASTEKPSGKKTIRSVGPTFISPRTP